MRRALAAYLAVALAFPALVLLLGLHHALGGAAIVVSTLMLVVLLLGLPTLILFCRRQWWEPWRFVAGGGIGGVLCAMPLIAAPAFSPVYLVILFGLFGIGCSIVFWFAGIWRNDQLTCPKEFRLPNGTRFPVARGRLKKPPGSAADRQ